jgi:Mycobacterium membrane protein
MPLVTVIAVSVGLVGMDKVHQFSEPEPVITVNGPQAPENFNTKKLTYEVYGPVGKTAKIVYVDIVGHPNPVDVTFTTEPWIHYDFTKLTVASGSISVHVHGGPLRCRMLVNDVLPPPESGTPENSDYDHPDADVECRVKSA